MTDHLDLHLDRGTVGPRPMAEAYFSTRAGRLLSTVVTYDADYVADPAAFPVSPTLPLFTGGQHADGLPGFLSDCAPDRWGRNLITQRHRTLARAEGRTVSTLTDVDFLVGVSDLTRQGAVRLSTEPNGPYLSTGTDVPALVDLPRLLHAADAVSSGDDFAAIKVLLDAGSGALGGARPKASVRDGDLLMIAKFPHQHDDWDVMAWEKLTLDLAADAGIRVPPTRLTRVDGRGVLLLERFDRRGAARVPYVSSMTLLDARDAEAHDYLEVAEAMPEVSAATRADLNELWRRIAFSLMVNNTDDHLRNHGLLHERGGWRLSPAFDINPNPDTATERVTSVDGARTRDDALDALRAHASAFDLSDTVATLTLHEVSAAVKRWREVARRLSIAPREIDQFADTFWAPA